MDKENNFYVINKAFWDSWAITVTFHEDKTVVQKN